MELSLEAQEVVNTAKAAGYKPKLVTIGGTNYVYRGMNRPEWKDYVKVQTPKEGQEVPTKEEIEDLLVKQCLIWPSPDDLTAFSGGVVAILAELILEACGFAPIEGQPIEL